MPITSIPTSFGGVSIPGGLINGPLKDLYKKKNKGLTILQYPDDLGTNPARAHIVNFYIKEIDPIGIIEKTKRVIEKQQIMNSVEGDFTPETKRIDSYISLYMPDTLNMSYNAQFSTISLTDSFGTLGAIGQTVLDVYQTMKSSPGVIDTLKNLANNGTAARVLGNLIDGRNGQNGADILLNAQGKAINPQMQLLYRGIDLRTFQLDFLFTPKNASESKVTKEIIDKFTYHFLPTLSGAAGGGTGQYFTLPSVFEIEFKFLQQDSSITSAALNSIFGNLGKVGSALSEITQTKGSGVENLNIYKVGECVLTNLNVDYAPNGWSAFYDGAPLQTRLTLQFQEKDIMHRGIFQPYNENSSGVR